MAKAMRLVVRHPGRLKCVSENSADRRSVCPVVPGELDVLELLSLPNGRQGLRKQRIAMAPELHGPQVVGPGFDNASDFVPDREELRYERLAELGLHLTGVLKERPAHHIQVLELR